MLVDVTRCRIDEPTYSPWQYWSAKDRFYAVKYEIAITAVEPKRIVSVVGPYKGSVSDLTIFREELEERMDEQERCVGDSAYIGADKVAAPFRNPQTRYERDYNHILHLVRQSVERMNHRLKVFGSLKSGWRNHDFDLHELAFKSACKIINEALREEPL